MNAVRKRYDATAKPKNLSIIAVAACGDGKGRGMDQLAAEGLTRAITFGWAGLSPALLKMISAKKISAYNLPLGVGEHQQIHHSMTLCTLACDATAVWHLGCACFLHYILERGQHMLCLQSPLTESGSDSSLCYISWCDGTSCVHVGQSQQLSTCCSLSGPPTCDSAFMCFLLVQPSNNCERRVP